MSDSTQETIQNTTLRDGHELKQQSTENIMHAAIGRQIRKLRKGKNLTVSDLSRVANISVAMISKMENGQISPSLATLQRIAEALSTSMSSLFIQYEECLDVSFVPSGQGLEIERRGTRAGHHYRLLGHGVRGEVHMEPYLVTLNRESDVFPWFQHNGVEFIHILSGEMVYRHGAELYKMKPGDSLFFDPKTIHGPEQLTSLPITFLTVISYAENS